MQTITYIGWLDNKVLLFSTGNYIQSAGINHDGKEFLKKKACVCITESLCHTTEINTAL